MGIFSKLTKGFGSGLLESQEQRMRDDQDLRSKRLSAEFQRQEDARNRKLTMGVSQSLELGERKGAENIVEVEGEEYLSQLTVNARKDARRLTQDLNDYLQYQGTVDYNTAVKNNFKELNGYVKQLDRSIALLRKITVDNGYSVEDEATARESILMATEARISTYDWKRTALANTHTVSNATAIWNADPYVTGTLGDVEKVRDQLIASGIYNDDGATAHLSAKYTESIYRETNIREKRRRFNFYKDFINPDAKEQLELHISRAESEKIESNTIATVENLIQNAKSGPAFQEAIDQWSQLHLTATNNDDTVQLETLDNLKTEINAASRELINRKQNTFYNELSRLENNFIASLERQDLKDAFGRDLAEPPSQINSQDRMIIKRKAKQSLALAYSAELNRDRLLQVSKTYFNESDPVSVGAVVASEFIFKLNTDQLEWPEVERKIKQSEYLTTEEIESAFDHIMNFKNDYPEQWQLISGDEQDPFVPTQFSNLYGVEFKNIGESRYIGNADDNSGIIGEVKKSLVQGETPTRVLNDLVAWFNKPENMALFDESLSLRILNATVNYMSGMERLSVRTNVSESAQNFLGEDMEGIGEDMGGRGVLLNKDPLTENRSASVVKAPLDETWWEKYQGNLGLFDPKMKNFKTEEEYDAWIGSTVARRDSIRLDNSTKEAIRRKEDWKKTWEWVKGSNTRATGTRSIYGGVN
jgi:hypothetical protein